MPCPTLPSLAALALAALAAGGAAAGQVTVFAAASMKTAMDEIAPLFAEATGDTAVVSLAGSSALARQIQAGAPADVFISANPGWMDALEADGLIEADSRTDLLGNSLVLIAHDPQATPIEITPTLPLSEMLGEDHLAMALVEAVPAGIYGKAALSALGLWDGVAPKVAQADNVRAALALVATGEAPFGIVYATDARAEPGVTVLGTFPKGSHAPITYPAARIRDGDSAVADAFLAFLKGPVARAAFERQGFTVLTE
ncbi:molybdate ABC transporter substrate-binding protein [Salipiger bermudensis]|uniref:molybdate ABC transporter substrate-binding protein n=1 Tax=Salipiger bermudensis TaxID=344736 RepID=UPI001C98F267|nr:molybdate ABC transporter substrate-binding protein [Salipiger bermudensis]MBY6002856.1 molybdate ABC transporter substrate-binding protein [Salipiger bermudensis]